MRASLSLITAPTDYPLTIAEARVHVRQELTDDDLWLDDAIRAATGLVETATNRQLLTATSRLSLDGWPCDGWIDLPRPPLVAVTGITYLDTDGGQQTWAAANYRVSAPAGPKCDRGRIALAYGALWPTVQDVSETIAITFTHGYGAASDVPRELKQAVKLLVGHWYDNRSAVMVGTISKEIELAFRALTAPFRSRAEQ